MGAAPVLIDVADGVITLTLNRPAARNALSPDLLAALDAALTQFEEDPAIHAGVVTGAGSAFCAGLDLKVFASADSDRRSARSVLHRFGRLTKPIIGAINGPAITGGLEIALGCDFLVGSPSALFADTHRTVGAFPGGGLSARLVHAVGVRTAKAMSLAGLRVSAQQALQTGLLAEVVPRDALLSRSRELAAGVSANDPAYTRTLRDLFDANADRSLADALTAERAALADWWESRPRAWNP